MSFIYVLVVIVDAVLSVSEEYGLPHSLKFNAWNYCNNATELLVTYKKVPLQMVVVSTVLVEDSGLLDSSTIHVPEPSIMKP